MTGAGGGGPTVTCEMFRERLEELALGELDGAERGRLLAHGADCPSCQARLDELALLTDRLLLAAPELEPPAGFEGRVLDHLAAAAAGAVPREASARSTVAAWSDRPPVIAGDRGPRRPRRVGARLLVAVAAVVVLLAALTGAFLVGRGAAPDDSSGAVAGGATSVLPPEDTAPAAAPPVAHAVRTGAVVRSDGSRSGTATLVDLPRPLVLVTVDSPRPSANRVSCQLVLADGTAVTVGSWGYDDVAGGAWAVGIDPSLLGAVRMNVLDGTGRTLATAELV